MGNSVYRRTWRQDREFFQQASEQKRGEQRGGENSIDGSDLRTIKAGICAQQLKKGWGPLTKTDVIAIIVRLDHIPEDSSYAFFYQSLTVRELITYLRVLLYMPEVSQEEIRKFSAYYPKRMLNERRQIQSFSIQQE
jgi:hypothetical protein